MKTKTTFKRVQRGATLVEAMIGLLVLSIGLAGATKLQAWMRASGDMAHERSEAVRVAQRALERWRHGATPSTTAPETFQLDWTVDAQGASSLHQTADAKVSWLDRGGHAHSVRLSAISPKASSIYSAVLSLAPQDARFGARRQLPTNARILDDRRSLIRLSRHSATTWLMDNATGQVMGRCAIEPARPLNTITIEDLRSCNPAAGSLLSGYIRFSTVGKPDALTPSDKPFETNVGLTLDTLSAEPPACEVDTPAGQGRPSLAYTCVIQQNVESGWSGRLDLLPVDWLLASTAGAYKACRYSADWDNSGRIDQNVEHPAHYSDVRGPLRQQNYLVIRGDAVCPTGQPPHNQASTVQHQP